MKSFLLTLLALLLALPNSVGQTSWKIVQQELLFTKGVAFAQCHASTLVETAPGHLLAAWFGGSAESQPDVAIWLSAHDGKQWSPPVKVAEGIINDTLRYPTWNPVLFQTRSETQSETRSGTKAGKLFLFYKVGPSPREWWGMVQTSADAGRTWTTARRLPEGILGPIKNKPVELPDGSILSPSSVETNTHWSVHLERSSDQGQTWQRIPVDPMSAFDVIQPSILQYSGQRLQLLCRSKQGNVMQAWSTDGGKQWGTLRRTSLPNPNAGTDAVSLRQGGQLIVYNPARPGKDWWEGRSRLQVAVSKDGQQWSDVAVLEKGSREEYSYPAVIQTQDGRVHITYTFDRKAIKHVVLEALESGKR